MMKKKIKIYKKCLKLRKNQAYTDKHLIYMKDNKNG